MRVQKIKEFNESRLSGFRTNEIAECKDMKVDYGTLMKADNNPNNKGGIVLPNHLPSDKKLVKQITDIIDLYIVDHFLADEVNDYQVGSLLAGEYRDNEIVFDEQSLCVLCSGALSDSKHLKEIAIRIMNETGIDNALVLAGGQVLEIARLTDNGREPLIKRLEDF